MALDPQVIQFLVVLIQGFIIATVLMLGFGGLTVVERKLVARFTLRYGPNRVGPYGSLQILADMLKMFFKEEVIPGHVDRLVYLMAPAMSLIPALIAIAVVPIANEPIPLFEVGGTTITLNPWIANINVGILYLLAVGSLGTYGVVLGGWSSNNKYSLLGGLRTSAQMLSYELPMGVALLSVILFAGTLNLNEMVQAQGCFFGVGCALGWGWFIFVPTLTLSFLIYFISALAEAGRAPFDLPETENELIGGFATEYGAMKFGLFFGAEYVHVIVISCIVTTIFLGGWQGPLALQIPMLQPIYFLIKMVVMIFMFIWIRASIPRVRFDKMMRFCWKFLLPLGMVNLAVTALILAILNF
ncbi:MAG: NADH-quinone oxidoreductase subunit NuoH [Anaerolineae bacterium]|nr:NADH-quinone oxidoreductase subunit NuoH [Anaerolineales bacterium]MCQ3973630.1 NADH-quinone oxidoreductase subunit NuoH [Anaerolineae bacterium]